MREEEKLECCANCLSRHVDPARDFCASCNDEFDAMVREGWIELYTDDEIRAIQSCRWCGDGTSGSVCGECAELVSDISPAGVEFAGSGSSSAVGVGMVS